jgi:hypothetical protein
MANKSLQRRNKDTWLEVKGYLPPLNSIVMQFAVVRHLGSERSIVIFSEHVQNALRSSPHSAP